MTIDEAIKLLRSDIDNPGSVDILDLNKAEELGIEALKRIRYQHSHLEVYVNDLLPGETKD